MSDPVSISTVDEIVNEMRAGRMVILVDEDDRENEGDLILAAEHVTPEAINFMVTHARGLVCLTITEERAKQLGLTPMANVNNSQFGTAFTTSIEAAEGVTTGISVQDRAHTIRVALAPEAKPEDLVMPGHIFPITAREGGVLVRAGHTEAGCDLARLAGLEPASVICEVLNDDGTMARLPELKEFAATHGIKICTIADLVAYRLKNESLVKIVADAHLPTAIAGDWRAIAFENQVDKLDHIALVKGTIVPGEPTLVRVHSECLTGDVLGSQRCDCGDQLHTAMRMIDREGTGVILYMRQEGRGIGLVNKLKAYELQDRGLDTVEANNELGFKADLRDYGIGAQMLVALRIRKMRLITNNPRKIIGLRGYGVEVVERVPIELAATTDNAGYLKTKRDKLGHMLANL